MKLSVSTLGCPGWGLEKAFSFLNPLGISALEVRGLDGIIDTGRIPCFQDEVLPKTAEYLKQGGNRIISIGTSVFLHIGENEEKYKAEVEDALRVCKALGIPYIRVFGDTLPEGEGRKEALATVLRQGETICAMAEEAGVGMNLEIHGNMNTVENLAPVLDALYKRPGFGLIWDVMHTDRSMGDKWDIVYRLIRPFIRHIHIKDHERNSTPPFHQVLLGKGNIPLTDIVTRLLADGYDGYFSLECEKLWHPDIEEPEVAFPQFAEFMKQFEK